MTEKWEKRIALNPGTKMPDLEFKGYESLPYCESYVVFEREVQERYLCTYHSYIDHQKITRIQEYQACHSLLNDFIVND